MCVGGGGLGMGGGYFLNKLFLGGQETFWVGPYSIFYNILTQVCSFDMLVCKC